MMHSLNRTVFSWDCVVDNKLENLNGYAWDVPTCAWLDRRMPGHGFIIEKCIKSWKTSMCGYSMPGIVPLAISVCSSPCFHPATVLQGSPLLASRNSITPHGKKGENEFTGLDPALFLPAL